jgi:arabinan endo-1,5-alpha-L-arabinosidase
MQRVFSKWVCSHIGFVLSGAFMVVLLESGCATANDQAKIAGRIYQNPVYAGDMPDPSVKQLGDYYYAFGTTGSGRLPDGRIFKMLRSRNLVDWEPLGGALVPPSDNRRYQYWAPEITENQGKYYLYYSMGGIKPERFVIRVGVSDKPQGPYTDSGAILTDCESNRFTIDPFPFRDDDGQWYFFYSCNFPYESNGLHAGTGIVVDRLINMTRLGGERHLVLRAASDWTLYESNRWMSVYNRTFDWHTIEGPCVLKHGEKYYCLYSGANWQTTRYGLDYVVADNPLGPYTGAGDHARVLHGIPGKVRGPGHNSVVTGPDGKTQYVVYHAWDEKMTKRQMCVDRLDWTLEGPHCTPTVTPQPLP